MPTKQPLKPGNKAPNSGQYLEVGPRGGKTTVEITGVKGKTMPPTAHWLSALPEGARTLPLIAASHKHVSPSKFLG
ncbi:YjzC family protein [Nocardia fluminea]|uniref:YjzC family protein n=1 Tax=Nocardia fluminea TaxID=134984 RepID=UPI00340F6A01